MGSLLGELLNAPVRPSKERMATYGNRPDDNSIVQKAVDHAKERLKQGKSPYAGPDEFHPLPKE